MLTHGYTLTRDDAEIDVTLEVEATPGCRASHRGPAEPAELVVEARTKDGRRFELTEAEFVEIEPQAWGWLNDARTEAAEFAAETRRAR